MACPPFGWYLQKHTRKHESHSRFDGFCYAGGYHVAHPGKYGHGPQRFFELQDIRLPIQVGQSGTVGWRLRRAISRVLNLEAVGQEVQSDESLPARGVT